MSKVVDTDGTTLGLGLSRTVTIVATGFVLTEKLALFWPAETMVGSGEIGLPGIFPSSLALICTEMLTLVPADGAVAFTWTRPVIEFPPTIEPVFGLTELTAAGGVEG